MGAVPVHVPGVAVSVPSEPETCGSEAFTGGAARTTLVAGESEPESPSALAAVTSTRRRWPMSAQVGM